MAKAKVEIIQATSPENNVFLIHKIEDGNTKDGYEIYKLVKSIDVAREFGISETVPGRKTKLNTREMCDKMVQKIKTGVV
jgi:hypothetical protein